MDLHWHVAQSALVGVFLILTGLISYGGLFAIIALTLAVDLVDHGMIIWLGRSDVTKLTASFVAKGEILTAYRYYSARRLGASSYMYLHNLLFVGSLAVLCVATYAAGLSTELVMILLFGPILHLVSDFISSWTRENTADHLRFWTANPAKACYTRVSRRVHIRSA